MASSCSSVTQFSVTKGDKLQAILQTTACIPPMIILKSLCLVHQFKRLGSRTRLQSHSCLGMQSKKPSMCHRSKFKAWKLQAAFDQHTAVSAPWNREGNPWIPTGLPMNVFNSPAGTRVTAATVHMCHCCKATETLLSLGNEQILISTTASPGLRYLFKLDFTHTHS